MLYKYCVIQLFNRDCILPAATGRPVNGRLAPYSHTKQEARPLRLTLMACYRGFLLWCIPRELEPVNLLSLTAVTPL